MRLTNSTYDLLKKFVQVVLPALATLYAGLAELWHLPYVTGVVGTMTLLATFLGVVLHLSSSQYNQNEGAPDGSLVVSNVDGETYFSLGIQGKSAKDLASKASVNLAVVHNNGDTSEG